MIEIEATCNRFDVARIEWSSDKTPGQSREFVVGYPGVERPIYRITLDPGGKPITTLRLQFPGGAAVDVKRIRVHELAIR